MAVLGFVPGMPTLMFLAIAAVAGWFAWRAAKGKKVSIIPLDDDEPDDSVRR